MFAHTNCGCKMAKETCQRYLAFLLYIMNTNEYRTFELSALCVRARTMHGLEMHLMFCYNEF